MQIPDPTQDRKTPTPHQVGSQETRTERFLVTLMPWILRLRRGQTSSSAVLFGFACVLFVAATVVAYIQLPDADVALEVVPLVGVIGIGTLTAVVTNALEFAVLARLLGHSTHVQEALRISVFSSAANLLPIPGSVVIRFQVFRRRGSRIRDISLGVAVVGLVFLGVTGLLCGFAILATKDVSVGLILLMGGGVLSSAGLLFARSLPGRSRGALVALVLVEAACVISLAARTLLVLLGMGLSVSVAQVMALTAGGVAGVAVAIVPAGIGVRELVAGAFSPLVDLPVAVGIFSGALDRVLTAIGMGALAAILAVARQSGSRAGTATAGT